MKKCMIVIGLLWAVMPCFALTFNLPSANSSIIGQLQTFHVEKQQSFAAIARQFDIGYMELVEANPGVNPAAPRIGTVLVIPTQYILPDAPRHGIVVNIAELRLYYYPPGGKTVETFPVGIGLDGSPTPLGRLKVVQRIKNPVWTIPLSIRQARAKEGIYLPAQVPPGPNNPLGDYALRLSAWSYLIHGTDDPLGGIGRRSSAGCLRMYPEDIAQLYAQVKLGTSVTIVNQPNKVGWMAHRIYLESHIPLNDEKNPPLQVIAEVIKQHFAKGKFSINWQRAGKIASEKQGIPQVIGNLYG